MDRRCGSIPVIALLAELALPGAGRGDELPRVAQGKVVIRVVSGIAPSAAFAPAAGHFTLDDALDATLRAAGVVSCEALFAHPLHPMHAAARPEALDRYLRVRLAPGLDP